MAAIKRLVSLLLVLLFPVFLAAQCCAAGNPVSLEARQVILNPGDLVVAVHYRHSAADTYYAGGNVIALNAPGVASKTWYDFSKITATYSLSRVFSFQVEQGYFFSRAEAYSDAQIGTFLGRGLGDMQWHLRSQHLIAYGLYLLPSVGITLPLGSFDLEKDNVRLPITVQPSSGDFKYHLNLKMHKVVPGKKWGSSLNLGFEYPQLIQSKHFFYQYGNRAYASGTASYQLSDRFMVGMLMNFEMRGRSKREDKQTVNSTGYRVFFLSPYLGMGLGKEFHLGISMEKPLLRYYNGIQIGNKYALGITLAKQFKSLGIKGK